MSQKVVPPLRIDKIVLASDSLRRAELLKLAGIPFIVVPSGISEDEDVFDNPVEHVLELSRRKAEMVAQKVAGSLVLGADTIVVLEGSIIGKPQNRGEAADILSRLSGNEHRVFTGITLLDTDKNECVSDVVITSVRMRKMSTGEIRKYIDTGEPLDKAGAYGIQGKGSVFIESVCGCYYNVMGLPISKLVLMLRKMGYEIW